MPSETSFETSRPDDRKLAILMATYNGSQDLPAQLESFAIQTRRPDLILVSDDGSRDDTRRILAQFAEAQPGLEVRVIDGPCCGAAQNFLNLLRNTPDWVDVIALSDQDDVWMPEKLQRGLDLLDREACTDVPLLYCGRSWECDEVLGNQRLSRGMPRPACFGHALVQNVAGGNTMMMNRAALALTRAASFEAGEIVVHDWWIYQIVSGAGGRIVFDDMPFILYRQHGNNLIGANRGMGAKVKRLKRLFSGEFSRWNTLNIAALKASAHRFLPENRDLLDRFEKGRHDRIRERIRLVSRPEIYRTGLAGTLSLYLAAVLGRL